MYYSNESKSIIGNRTIYELSRFYDKLGRDSSAVLRDYYSAIERGEFSTSCTEAMYVENLDQFVAKYPAWDDLKKAIEKLGNKMMKLDVTEIINYFFHQTNNDSEVELSYIVPRMFECIDLTVDKVVKLLFVNPSYFMVQAIVKMMSHYETSGVKVSVTCVIPSDGTKDISTWLYRQTAEAKHVRFCSTTGILEVEDVFDFSVFTVRDVEGNNILRQEVDEFVDIVRQQKQRTSRRMFVLATRKMFQREKLKSVLLEGSLTPSSIVCFSDKLFQSRKIEHYLLELSSTGQTEIDCFQCVVKESDRSLEIISSDQYVLFEDFISTRKLVKRQRGQNEGKITRNKSTKIIISKELYIAYSQKNEKKLRIYFYAMTETVSTELTVRDMAKAEEMACEVVYQDKFLKAIHEHVVAQLKPKASIKTKKRDGKASDKRCKNYAKGVVMSKATFVEKNQREIKPIMHDTDENRKVFYDITLRTYFLYRLAEIAEEEKRRDVISHLKKMMESDFGEKKIAELDQEEIVKGLDDALERDWGKISMIDDLLMIFEPLNNAELRDELITVRKKYSTEQSSEQREQKRGVASVTLTREKDTQFLRSLLVDGEIPTSCDKESMLRLIAFIRFCTAAYLGLDELLALRWEDLENHRGEPFQAQITKHIAKRNELAYYHVGEDENKIRKIPFGEIIKDKLLAYKKNVERTYGWKGETLKGKPIFFEVRRTKNAKAYLLDRAQVNKQLGDMIAPFYGKKEHAIEKTEADLYEKNCFSKILEFQGINRERLLVVKGKNPDDLTAYRHYIECLDPISLEKIIVAQERWLKDVAPFLFKDKEEIVCLSCNNGMEMIQFEDNTTARHQFKLEMPLSSDHSKFITVSSKYGCAMSAEVIKVLKEKHTDQAGKQSDN